MKKILSSVIALFICCSFIVSPMCLGAETSISLPELIIETIFSEFIGEGVKEAIQDGSMPDSGIFGCAEEVMKKALEIAMENPTVDGSTGDLSLTVPTFDIITGKEQLEWTVEKRNNLGEVTETFTDSILIEVTFLLTNNWSATYYDKNTGTTYYSNALNICITRTNGSVKHYVVVFGTGYNYQRSVTWSYPTISISAQGGCTLYTVEGGVIGQTIQTNFYTENCIFNVSDINSITTNLNSLITNVNSYPSPIGIYSRRGNSISADGINYPVDIDICHGCFNFRLLNSSNNSTKYEMAVYCNRYLKTGFMITNNSIHSATNNTYYSVNNYSNNYYNYPITGGTIIDKNNYEDKNLPSLAPVFDLDTSLPDWDLDLLDLIPSILDLLDGDLLPDLTDLLGRLLDFFGSMPDIDMQWNPDTSLNTNNYWELDFPSDDSGGGGSGGDNILVTVEVDITRPLVTVYDYEDPVSLNSLPVITTYTVPAEIQTAADTVLDSANSILNTSDLLPIYAFLTLIGIGVALVFKGV